MGDLLARLAELAPFGDDDGTSHRDGHNQGMGHGQGQGMGQGMGQGHGMGQGKGNGPCMTGDDGDEAEAPAETPPADAPATP